jgi:hypothetical protein
MAACSKYMKRFRFALQYRKLPFPKEIIDYMGKRATSDRSLDGIICNILNIIEPPYCQKSHCEHHTTYGFCGCSKNLVPGKCKLNLEYLKRKKEKEERILGSRTAQLPKRYLPLSDETKAKVLSMTQSQWDNELRKILKYEPEKQDK